MKAIVQTRYGPPEVLELRDDVDKPALEDDRVLVRVRASSVNAGDWRRVRASPRFIRLIEGVRRPKTPGLGGDAAGVVEAVGKDVAGLRPGDEVYGIRTGAFAEYVCGRNFVPKPANLTFEQSAAVPVAGITALQAVRDRGRVKPGQRVLVTGAGGGVGTLGADHVIDYTHEDFTKERQRYEVIIEVSGRYSLSACRRALKPDGTLVVVGAGKGILGPLGRLVSAVVRSRLLRQRVVVFIANVNRQDLDTLRELIEAGKVRPVIDRTYPLAEIVEAMRYVETERARGKVIITA